MIELKYKFSRIHKVDKKSKKSEKILDTALLLFSKNGFYATTIPDIAKAMGMSVGNIYNYFTSKEKLAKEIIKYSSDILGEEIRKVNEQKLSSKEKIRAIVAVYFEMASTKPQHINYFLRVYLANKEVFKEGCEEMFCFSPFVTELMMFFEDGVANGELKNQEFFSAFGLFIGYLGGFVFLNDEGVLNKDLNEYVDDIALNIYHALKVQ